MIYHLIKSSRFSDILKKVRLQLCFQFHRHVRVALYWHGRAKQSRTTALQRPPKFKRAFFLWQCDPATNFNETFFFPRLPYFYQKLHQLIFQCLLWEVVQYLVEYYHYFCLKLWELCCPKPLQTCSPLSLMTKSFSSVGLRPN